MTDVRLIVNGRRYGGWKSIRVTQSITSIAGSFALDVSERWSGQEEGWPISEEDACRVELDGETVIDGYIDRRRPTLGDAVRTLSLEGRDRTAALVDCSAMLGRWSFRNVTVAEMAKKVAEPHGIGVSLQSGLALPKMRKLVISPGDTGFQAIQKAAQSAGVLLVSDGAGGLLVTRAGAERCATPLLEGENIKTASGDYDATGRFARYVVATQIAGTDQASGGATRITAEATDENVRRADRVLLIRPESGVAVEHARRLADWEARLRAAKADAISVGVQGWRQPTGERWPLNGIVYVRSPSIGVDGDLLISQVEHTTGEGGEATKLSLVRPDAFAPEPKAKVKRKGKGSEWKRTTKAWQDWWESL